MTVAPDPRVVPAVVSDDRGNALNAIMARVTGSYDWKQALALRLSDVPTAMLPYAIRSYGVQDYIEPGMLESFQRAILENALTLKVAEGTIKGVRFGLSLLGMQVEWTQWTRTDPLGAPGTHKVTVYVSAGLFEGEPLLSERVQLAALRVINKMKRLSQDVGFQIGAAGSINLACGVAGLGFAIKGVAAWAKPIAPVLTPAIVAGAVGCQVSLIIGKAS